MGSMIFYLMTLISKFDILILDHNNKELQTSHVHTLDIGTETIDSHNPLIVANYTMYVALKTLVYNILHEFYISNYSACMLKSNSSKHSQNKFSCPIIL